MSIYGFGILSGYVYSGVDSAQGVRTKLLRENGIDIIYFYVARPVLVMPNRERIKNYQRLGIDLNQMSTPWHVLTGRDRIAFNDSPEAVISDIKRATAVTGEKHENDRIILYNGNYIVGIIYLFDGAVYSVSYYNLDGTGTNSEYLTEYYSDGLLYSEYKKGSVIYRTFFDINGSVAFSEIVKKDDITYQFIDGETVNVVGLWEKVIKKLSLSEEDICVLDRPGYIEYQEALFKNRNGARIFAVLHSEHFYKLHENIGSVYLNYEYYYWFNNSADIERFIVGTEEQRDNLYDFLKRYNRAIPRIEVIPPGVLKSEPDLSLALDAKNPYSLVTVSRLEYGKQVDMLVRSVAKAHDEIPEIDFCIYGDGFPEEIDRMNELITLLNAGDYIHLMGHQDVSKVYEMSEIYLTASLNESFGLTLLEAAAGGCALVGLNVRYGNKLFIKPGQNGFLVDFDCEKDWNDKTKAESKIAERIVTLLKNKELLRQYQKKSLQVACDYVDDNAFGRWCEILACR